MHPTPDAKGAPRSGSVSTIGFHLTDTGNAERLVARNRDRIRFCTPRKRWLLWDGKRWAWDQLGEIEQVAKQTVRAVYAEAEHARDADQREAIARHATHSEKRERRAAMVALAQTEPGVPLLPSQLDADPWALNVGNGTLDLRTGALREHRRCDLITKLAPVDFEPGARHALWERYLADATGGDAELAAYLQRIAGYALYGQVTEKAWWFLYGPPNGTKSTFIDALSSALGDYAVSADFSTWLVQTSTGGNRGDLVALLGARLVCSVEVRKGAKFDEAIMKRVTGGDTLTAAAKYEAEITFAPSFALWLAANDAPAARDDDEGFWARVRRIPFVHCLPQEKQDQQMRTKLRAPDVQQAILAWAVQGCLDWQREGFGACKAVEESTAKYREEMDRVAGFFAGCCVFEAGAEVTTKQLRAAYDDWCKQESVRTPLSTDDLVKRLSARGCKKGKVGRDRGWKGVRLLRDWEDSDEAGTAETPGTAFLESSSAQSSWGDFRGNGVSGVPRVPRTPEDNLEAAAIAAEGSGE